MISVEEAQERILAAVQPLDAVDVPLQEALGLVLAEDVRAGLDIPSWDNSAMDGYAVRAGDIAAASTGTPVELPVIGEAAAGRMPDREVTPGTAIRIMTGAPIPRGADAVVPFEDTDETERRAAGSGLARIAIRDAARKGDNVRVAGEDVRKGALVLEKGAVLRAGHIGVLASLGRPRVRVVRRPTVAVLATGDEVVPPGGALGPGQIYDANSYSVSSLARGIGVTPRFLGIAGDTVASLSAKVRALRGFDFVITSAGVSAGYYDVVKEVLAAHGELDLWTVRMRPGKPVAFGLLTGSRDDPWPKPVPMLGLPGNPVSSMVVFQVLARAALLKMMGYKQWEPPTVEVVLEEPIRNAGGRRTYARAFLEKRDGAFHARLSGPQGSNILTAMARANGLVICPEDVPLLRAGDTAHALLLE